MRKKYLIIIFIAFVLCITIFINRCSKLITGGSKSSSNIEEYLNSGTAIDSKAKDIMPVIDDLPKYKNISYKYTHKPVLLFDSEAFALIVKYDDKTYKNEKDKLVKKYFFLDKKIDFDGDKGEYIIPEYEFSINSYTFKVVAGNGKDNTQFPKSFGMIGTSEEKKSIAYLYFYDTELDYIAKKNDRQPMAKFVKEHFEYDF